MVDQRQNTGEVNLVAIDIAKQWNVVLVQDDRGGHRSFKVANNRADHDRLVSYLKTLAGTVRVAFEPTGDFHRALAYRLLSEGFELTIDIISCTRATAGGSLRHMGQERSQRCASHAVHAQSGYGPDLLRCAVSRNQRYSGAREHILLIWSDLSIALRNADSELWKSPVFAAAGAKTGFPFV